MKTLNNTQFDLLLYFCKCDTGTDPEQVGFSGTMIEETGFFTSKEYHISFYANKEDNYRLQLEKFCVRDNDMVKGNGKWQKLPITASQTAQIRAILQRKVSTLIKDKKDAEIGYFKPGINSQQFLSA